jgi:Family of unknown function (DUF6308)
MCKIDAAIGLLTIGGTWSAKSINPKEAPRTVVADPVGDLTRYLRCFTGKDYDREFTGDNTASPDLFTATSLEAIKHLSVDTPPRFKSWLLSPSGQKKTGNLLAKIPDTDLGTLTSEEFNGLLAANKKSPTSKLWHLLREKLIEFEQPRRMGRQVTASKLIHGKRPRLVPITDSFVQKELGMTWATSWSCSYKIMTDPRIAPLCAAVRTNVMANGPFPSGVNPVALSDVRILDLAAWCFHRRLLHP